MTFSMLRSRPAPEILVAAAEFGLLTQPEHQPKTRIWAIVDSDTQLPLIRVAHNDGPSVRWRDLGYAKNLSISRAHFSATLTNHSALGPSSLSLRLGWSPGELSGDPLAPDEIRTLSAEFYDGLVRSSPLPDAGSRPVHELLAAAPSSGTVTLAVAPCVCGAGQVGLAGPDPRRHHVTLVRQDVHRWLSVRQ